MSKETRQAHTLKLSIRNAARGHDDSVAHSFNHTEGRCPKCRCTRQLMFFCSPNERNQPSYPGCELDGQHIHRGCGACRYQWIERPFDQLVFSQTHSEVPAESEIAAMLAATVERTGGITFRTDFLYGYRGFVLSIDRDVEQGTVRITVEPPEPQVGTPARMSEAFMDEGMGPRGPVESS